MNTCKERNPGRTARILLILILCLPLSLHAQAGRRGGSVVRYEAASPYHHIRVVDAAGVRTLYFDDAQETEMSLTSPLEGHFEYVDYFHMAWLWNTNISNVLMIGLGGASAQRSFEHYYPKARIESVEIDPLVVEVARNFFQYKESDRQKVHVTDGRMFLRRSKSQYDLIVLDAYTQGRYGSSIPQQLTTKEFFELVRDRLSTNGVVAYNVIGTQAGYRANLVGAIYRTMQAVFPQVYLFPARSSMNIVLVGTQAKVRANPVAIRQRAQSLVQNGQIKLPTFMERVGAFQVGAPVNASRSPVLTDDYAPVEGLATQN